MEGGSSSDLKPRRYWTEEEDDKLKSFVALYGARNWEKLACKAGLSRSGKSCRLRWKNHLSRKNPPQKFTVREEILILELRLQYGNNRWSKIAKHLPGRTDNDIKNFFNTQLKKKAKELNLDAYSREFLEEMRKYQVLVGAGGTGGGSAATAVFLSSTATADHAPFQHHLAFAGGIGAHAATIAVLPSSTATAYHALFQHNLALASGISAHAPTTAVLPSSSATADHAPFQHHLALAGGIGGHTPSQQTLVAAGGVGGGIAATAVLPSSTAAADQASIYLDFASGVSGHTPTTTVPPSLTVAILPPDDYLEYGWADNSLIPRPSLSPAGGIGGGSTSTVGAGGIGGHAPTTAALPFFTSTDDHVLSQQTLAAASGIGGGSAAPLVLPYSTAAADQAPFQHHPAFTGGIGDIIVPYFPEFDHQVIGGQNNADNHALGGHAPTTAVLPFFTATDFHARFQQTLATARGNGAHAPTTAALPFFTSTNDHALSQQTLTAASSIGGGSAATLVLPYSTAAADQAPFQHHPAFTGGIGDIIVPYFPEFDHQVIGGQNNADNHALGGIASSFPDHNPNNHLAFGGGIGGHAPIQQTSEGGIGGGTAVASLLGNVEDWCANIWADQDPSNYRLDS